MAIQTTRLPAPDARDALITLLNHLDDSALAFFCGPDADAESVADLILRQNRITVLREAAGVAAPGPDDCKCGACGGCISQQIATELHRLADAAQAVDRYVPKTCPGCGVDLNACKDCPGCSVCEGGDCETCGGAMPRTTDAPAATQGA